MIIREVTARPSKFINFTLLRNGVPVWNSSAGNAADVLTAKLKSNKWQIIKAQLLVLRSTEGETNEDITRLFIR